MSGDFLCRFSVQEKRSSHSGQVHTMEQKGGSAAMAKKQTLHYTFHDPNPPAKTADFLLKLFLEVDQKKIDAALQKAYESPEDTQKYHKISEAV